MSRPKPRFFVDPEHEIEEISSILMGGENVMLLGLRGYGKSALSARIAEILEGRGIWTLCIDCLKIVNPK